MSFTHYSHSFAHHLYNQCNLTTWLAVREKVFPHIRYTHPRSRSEATADLVLIKDSFDRWLTYMFRSFDRWLAYMFRSFDRWLAYMFRSVVIIRHSNSVLG